MASFLRFFLFQLLFFCIIFVSNAQNVGISTSSPLSNLHVEGSFGLQVKTVAATASYTAGSEAIILVDASTTPTTIHLPPAANTTDRIYTIKKIDSVNTVTVDANNMEQIDGALTITLSNEFDFCKIISDGVNWYVIGKNTVTASTNSGGFQNMQVFLSDDTWTVPSDVTQIMVEVWGGGGGGASGDSGGNRGSAGMGGGYGKSYFTVTPNSMHAIVIGAGGLGATSGPCQVGATGGTTTFGSPVSIQATGGQGGNGCGSNFTQNGGTSTGQLSMQGARGPDGQTVGRHYGGQAGDGSTIGQGGIGDTQFFGRDGAAGAVAIHW